MSESIKPPEDMSMSPEEAKEWMQLQSAICEKLTAEHVTNVKQLDDELVEPTRLHLVLCDVKNHPKIDGLYSDIS